MKNTTKKSLFDLSIKEFTSLLLGQIVVDEFGDIDIYNVDISGWDELSDLDVYNYIENKTEGFTNKEKGFILFREMECFYMFEWKDELSIELDKYYKDRGKTIPIKKLKFKTKNGIIKSEIHNYDKMINETLGCWVCLQYFNAIELIKRKFGVKQQSGTNHKDDNTICLPDTLNTERARKYFKKAMDLGYIKVDRDGLKWTDKKVSLGYFVEQVYCPNNKETLPETEINKLFRVSRIGTAISQMHNSKPDYNPQWKIDIDNKIFKDQ